MTLSVRFYFIIGAFIFLGSLGAIPACTQGGDSAKTAGAGSATDPGSNTLRSGGTSSRCATDAYKDDPMCRLVLVEYSGDLVSKFPNMPLDLHGTSRNSYYPNGKLQGITFYSDNDVDHPQVVTSFSYSREGDLLTSYSIFATKGDGVMDTKKEVLYIFENGKLLNFTDIVGPIDGRSTVPTRTEIHPAMPMSSILSIGMGIIWETQGFNNHVMTGANSIIKLFNSDGTLASHKQLPSLTSLAEDKIFTYTDKKFQNVVDRFYDCSGQPNKSCFDPASPQYAILPGLTPYLEINTTWTYSDGKPTQIYSTFDGDLDPHGSHAGVNGQIDYEWNCTITYDNVDQKVIAALSPDFDPWGLPADEKMKSISCDDKGAGLLSGGLNFDKWVYLWQAIPGGQEPGS